ncbi:OLC1v1012388C1 [Oldenlandia corymbosa var. corymbosa]|uniref:OLC1v1012388C1 n=1 Tax=Oldenlandia corymbosa var. corymbosa TaxID=529605 RepID=A0AAV1DXN1_OLDCO|nr:OLC1v1012388C1 [Oldenlandia corymbosa var. corymbosa]
MADHEVSKASSVMETLCNQAGDNFLFCIHCLEKTGHEDMNELGSDTISCAQRSVSIARKSLQDLAKNSSGVLRDAAEYCLPRLDEAASDFKTALSYWKYLHKKETLEYVNYGGDDYYKCTWRLPNNETSPELNRQLNCIRGRYEVILSVIKSIPV